MLIKYNSHLLLAKWSFMKLNIPGCCTSSLSFSSMNALTSFRLAIRGRRDASRRYVALLPVI